MGRVAGWILALSALAHGGEGYPLEVGQVLVYKTTSEHRYRALLGLAGETLRRSAETRLWVVRKNMDGSFRLCVRHTEGEEGEEPSVEFGWCDVAPDGRCVRGPTIAFGPSLIFKPLPPAGAKEWQARGDWGERLRMRVGEGGILEEAVESGRSVAGGATCTSRCTLRADGIPERIETIWSKGESDRRTTTTVLVETGTGFGAEALDRDLTAFAAFRDRSLADRVRAADEASFRAALKQGREVLRALAKDAKSPVFRAEAERILASDGAADDELVVEWRWGDTFRGKPAPDWTLEDLDGKRHALKDYRGKVVVLDFWYVECGPCRMAMPALKELGARHEGKVVVLGMNTDTGPEPARNVATAMELTYPTLRARETLFAYKVVAYPTTFVVDREGVVRYAFVGYGPGFLEQLEAAVADLLPPDPPPPSPSRK